MPFTLPELITAVRIFVSENLPGCTPEGVDITLSGREKPFHVPIPSFYSPPPPATAVPAAALKPEEAPADSWEPNEYQCCILEILEYRAFRSDALITELNARGFGHVRERLWRKGGIHELRDHGLVKLDKSSKGHPGVGFFRPDALPPELAEAAP